MDIRHAGKPVIIEGQSGTGKTTVAKKVLERLNGGDDFIYLTARDANDSSQISVLAKEGHGGRYIIDDFHRLESEVQAKLANLVKLAAEAETADIYPKIIIIGINRVGSELIYLVHDIAKRCGIHKVEPAHETAIMELIEKGEEKLNITIGHHKEILHESAGDYWLAQLLCQQICKSNGLIETSLKKIDLNFDTGDLRKRLVNQLENSFLDPVKAFCRGTRFRPTNDPYFKLLRAISFQDNSVVDLNDLANENPDVKGSINNIKETRINILLKSNELCDRYFYYNSQIKSFAIEDPALFYYLKHLDWDELRKSCGFKENEDDYEFDFAISFAGENRAVAEKIAELLGVLDCTVFYDKYYENNYLGRVWSNQFQEIFGKKSRLVICLLDAKHREKIWPTFERECFEPRIPDGAVIPIFLDDTLFPAISSDINGIHARDIDLSDENSLTDYIVLPLEERLGH